MDDVLMSKPEEAALKQQLDYESRVTAHQTPKWVKLLRENLTDLGLTALTYIVFPVGSLYLLSHGCAVPWQ